MAFADPSPCWDTITGLCCVALTTEFSVPTEDLNFIAYRSGSVSTRHLLIAGQDSGLNHTFFDNGVIPLVGSQVYLSIDNASAGCVHFDPITGDPHVWLVHGDGGLGEYFNKTEGDNWTLVSTLAPSGIAKVRAFIDDISGIRYIYAVTTANIVAGTIIDADGNVIEDWFDIDPDGADIDVFHSARISGDWKVTLWIVRESDGSLVQLSSADGVTFS